MGVALALLNKMEQVRPFQAQDAEAALVDRAVSGEPAAFASLYDMHLTRVFRYVYYHVGNRTDAEDLSQQVFLQAWRAIRSFKRGGSPFIAWLLTIAHNTVVTFRRQHREQTYIELEPEAIARWGDPESEALSGVDRVAVRRAILQLKPDQQQVIMMRFVEQFEYPEVAAALGKSEGNIRVLQYRALTELRRLLAPEVRGT
ncbi:MAG: RNA polymerase sigma factor [Chloroflexota bacterium]